MTTELWKLIKAYIEAKIDEKLNDRFDREMDDVSDYMRVRELDEEIEKLIYLQERT